MELSQAPGDRSQIGGSNRRQLSVSLQETRSWYRYAHTNPLIACRSAALFPPAPPPSSDAGQLHPSYGNNYAANFDVKYLGSGLVLHETDFGGCQTLLNERKRKRKRRKYIRMFGITITPKSFFAVDKLTGLLGGRLLDENDAEKLFRAIEVKMKHLECTPASLPPASLPTASLPPPNPNVILCNLPWLSGLSIEVWDTIHNCAELVQFEHNGIVIQQGDVSTGIYIIVSDLVKVRELSRDLEKVYVLHPHPTQTRLFGIITENVFSGTFYCYCYLTKRGSTGVDVLHAFRKACYLWLSNSNRKICEPSRLLSLSNQSVTPAGSEFAILDGIPENYIYGEQSGGNLKIRHRSGTKGRPKRPHSQAMEDSSLQEDIKQPSQEERTEQPSPPDGFEQPAPTASRQVSFAPVAKVNCYQLPGAKCVDIPLEQSISQSPIYAKVTSSSRTQKPQSKRNVPCLPKRNFPPPAPPQPPHPPPAPPLPVMKPSVLRTKSHPLPSQKPQPPSPKVESPCLQPPCPPPALPLPAIKPPVRIMSSPLPSWKPHPPSPRVEPIPPPPAPSAGPLAVDPYTAPVRVKPPAKVGLFARVKPYLSPAQQAPHSPLQALSARLPLLSAECVVQSEPEDTDSCPPTPPPRTCSLTKSHKLGMLGVY